MSTVSERKNAFTLIELLVVIAIIGMLLAIIVPALRNAKNKAKSLMCKNALHQYGLATRILGRDGLAFDEVGQQRDGRMRHQVFVSGSHWISI